MRARRLLLVVSAAVILLTICGGATALANIAIDNTLPGNPWFVGRRLKETLGIFLARNAAARATARENIVVRRLYDFAARAGTPYELGAFSDLDDAINASLVAIAELPPDERLVFLRQLTGMLHRTRELVSATALARNSDLLAQFDAKTASVRAASEGSTITPEGLRGVAIALPLTSAQSAADPPAMAVVTPRAIPPPTTFKHSFILDGAHSKIGCDGCHANGKYAGAPRDCVACHSDPHKNAYEKQCANCHTSSTWKPAKSK